MSKKTIGIKQADGSFFPILEDGIPARKTLDLTTVRDGQTAVKINLYKQYEDREDLEYVDTLLIENLIPHKKEEPSFNLSINLDEENLLTAEVVDPETGATSDTTVSLVTLSEAQLEDDMDFNFADTQEAFDEKTNSEMKTDSIDDFSTLADFDDDSSIDDFSFPEGEALSDDFSLGGDELEMPTESTVSEIESDDFSFPEDEALSDDFSLGGDELEMPTESTMSEIESDDFSFPEDEALSDDLSLGGDEFEMPTESSMSDISSDDFSFPEDEALSDDLSLGGDEFEIPTESSMSDISSDDFSFPEDEALTDDLSLGGDEFEMPTESSMSDISSDDFSFPEDNSTETLDISSTSTDSFSMDLDDFSTGIKETEDFGSSIDLDSDFDNVADDFSGSTQPSFDSFEDDSIEKDVFGSSTDEIKYAEHGSQNEEKENASFIPPLYDKKLKADIEKKRSRGKYSIPMIVCIVCAFVCIVAVILAFAFGAWPAESPSVVNNVVTVEPPQVFEKQQAEDLLSGKEVPPPPTPEENTIEILEEEEVIPVKPEPDPQVTMNVIQYKIVWGDTLWDLSDTYYRNPWLYNSIAEANGIKNPDYIIAGTYIDIPPQ